MKHLKLYEDIEDIYNNIKEELITLATNDCYWSWEYDAQSRVASILLDPNSNELFLEIKNTKIKSGIGAGKWTNTIAFEDVGKSNKPQLRKIQQLLSKHKISPNNRFNRQWIDQIGNELALGDLISKSRVAKLINLKNIDKHKQIHKQIQNTEDVNIMKYGKGYVIYGEGTREIKDDIKKLGARFNFRLRNPNTGDKFSGWVISPRKLEQAKELVGITQIQESFQSAESLYNLKKDIEESFNEDELIKLFPKMYDEFFNIVVDDSDLNYLKSEDPDELELYVATACSNLFDDWSKFNLEHSYSTELEIKFLKYYLDYKEFRIGTKKSYEHSEIYDTISSLLNDRLETIFWNLLEKYIHLIKTDYMKY